MGFPEFGHRHFSFEEQFLNIENLQFGNEVIASIDVSPEKPTGRTILFVKGWNARLTEYRSALGKVVAGGRPVVAGNEDDVQGLIRYLNLKGLEEVDIIAHSVGAINSVLAGLQDRRIKSLVLLNPPGDEKDSKGLIRKYKSMLSFEGAKNLADVGSRKIVEMANIITSFDMKAKRQLLESLGTKVKSIHGVSDILFPPPTTALPIDEENIKAGYNEFFIEGNHLGIDSFIPHALRFL